MVSLLIAILESAATSNPLPLIAEIGDIAIEQLEDDDIHKYVSQAFIDFAASGGNPYEYIKDEAIDVSIEAILNTVDALRHDVTKIEGGYYCETEITLQPYIDVSVPDAVSGLPENHHNVNPAFVMLRLIKKDGNYVCNPINPLNYVITQ